MGSSPDLEFRGDRIGYYGDKSWFVWLKNKATTDKNFRVCGCTETALALMSNQQVNSWEEWVKTNLNKTQEEWIRDGFLKYGVSIHLPPDTNDVESLLVLIGKRRWNFLQGGPQGTNAPGAIPDYVQYNAFRWLRDSGFNFMAYARTNTTLIDSQDMTIALIKYANWRSTFSSAERSGLGVLSFGKKSESDFGFAPPLIAKSWFLGVVYVSIFVFPLMGIWLLAFRKKTSDKP